MKMRHLVATTAIVLSVANVSLADNTTSPTLTNAYNVISGLKDVLSVVKNKTDVPVIFPKVVPQSSKPTKYYAYADLSQMKNGVNYLIDIDSTKDCHGIHYCNVGYVSAERGGNPQILHDMQNKEITIPVQLANHQKAYFTPGHAMADYFPAQIQWRDGSILYTIAWDTNQNNMITMANSSLTTTEN